MTHDDAGRRSSCPTLVDAVRDHALRGLSATVGVAEDDECDYPTFWNRVSAWRAGLERWGMCPGDRVAVEMETSSAVITLAVAVLAGGAALVPLPEAGSLRAGGRDVNQVRDAVRASGARWCVTVGDPAIYREALRDAELEVTVLSVAEVRQSQSMGGDAARQVTVDPDQPALIQFSSGSVAAPKGIVLTHRNLAANLDALTRRLGARDGRVVFWLPLSHDMGLIGCLGFGLYSGSALRALTPRTFLRDPLRWIRELAEFRATNTASPPFGYDMARRRAASDSTPLAGLDLSALEVAVIGAERVWPRLCREFEDAFAAVGLRPNVLLPAYGLAENCVAVACREPLRPRVERDFDAAELERGNLVAVHGAIGATPSVRRFIGHGTTLPGTEVRIASPEGDVLPDGRVGEIRVGGQAASRELLDADADGAGRPARQGDDLIATGDLGAVCDGELYVVGRTKEVLTYAGRLIAPTDVEQTVLQTVAGQVHAVAAVAVADPAATAEDLVLFVELIRPMDEPQARRLARAVRAAVLGEFQVPVRQIFVGKRGCLPRTTSGKIQRRALGTEYLRGSLDTRFRPTVLAPRRRASV